MSIFESIILGVVEGLTEFLPISSTAHLLLASDLMGIAETEFVKSFTIIIQLGAILAVAMLYVKRFFTDIETVKRVLVAFVPTAIIGFVLYKAVKGFLFEHIEVSLVALFVGGLFLIVFERRHIANNAYTELRAIPYQTAALVGLAQALAVVPGVSRAGATIVAGLLLGFSRSAIVEFSFLLAVPTMLAASGYDIMKQGSSFSSENIDVLLIGFMTAFIAALVAVKFFLKFIASHSFESFGWYRVGMAVLLAFLLW